VAQPQQPLVRLLNLNTHPGK